MSCKKYKLILTKEVETDLEKLKNFLSDELNEADYSDKVMRRLYAAITSLEVFPYRGVVVEENPQIRKLISKDELIYYYVDDIKNTVYIIFVASARQNVEALLQTRI